MRWVGVHAVGGCACGGWQWVGVHAVGGSGWVCMRWVAVGGCACGGWQCMRWVGVHAVGGYEINVSEAEAIQIWAVTSCNGQGDIFWNEARIKSRCLGLGPNTS